MLALMSSTSFCIAGFSWPLPTISRDWTIGMPAAIIVASCRLKTAMSIAVGLPPPPNRPALCVLTRVARDALAAQIRPQRRLVERQRLASHLVAALVLALPEELGFLLCSRLPISP